MKCWVQHDIDGTRFQECNLDTASDSFIRDFGSLCNETGNAAKDILAFKIAEAVEQTGENFSKIAATVEIHLAVYFGDPDDIEDFSGQCKTKICYKFEPTYPGLYREKFSDLNRTISNLIIAKYQNSGLFDI